MKIPTAAVCASRFVRATTLRHPPLLIHPALPQQYQPQLKLVRKVQDLLLRHDTLVLSSRFKATHTTIIAGSAILCQEQANEGDYHAAVGSFVRLLPGCLLTRRTTPNSLLAFCPLHRFGILAILAMMLDGSTSRTHNSEENKPAKPAQTTHPFDR